MRDWSPRTAGCGFREPPHGTLEDPAAESGRRGLVTLLAVEVSISNRPGGRCVRAGRAARRTSTRIGAASDDVARGTRDRMQPKDRAITKPIATEPALSPTQTPAGEEPRRRGPAYRRGAPRRRSAHPPPFAPSQQRVDGLEYAVAYQLADGAVGGDIVDVYHFDNGNVAVAIADISGKGRAGCASRRTREIRLRCYASEGSPATCTAFTDRVFVENNAFERTASFASVFLASIDSIAARSPIARRDTSRSSCAATRRAARRAGANAANGLAGNNMRHARGTDPRRTSRGTPADVRRSQRVARTESPFRGLAKAPSEGSAVPDKARSDPELLLAELGLTPKLTVYLGSAPGAGKTHRLLTDALREANAGRRVAIGWIETKGRPQLQEMAATLPRVRSKTYTLSGALIEDFDIDAALDSDYETIVLDELAHTNPSGAAHAKRWQDALALRAAGKSVLGAFNVMHVDSVASVAERIVGYPVRELVPLSFLRDADRVIALDVAPSVLESRLRAGRIVLSDDVGRAAAGLFQPKNLSMMRELLLRVVDGLTDPGRRPEQGVDQRSRLPCAIPSFIRSCVALPHSLMRSTWRSKRRRSAGSTCAISRRKRSARMGASFRPRSASTKGF